jgi:hypothetical protein
VSVQDIRPSAQDTSNFYLANIYQAIADPTNISLPSSPPPFSPPNYAIWVNALWFLSLVISLTCALLATLLQQWAQRYLRVTQPPHYRLYKRARIRSFFAEGVEKFLLPWAIEALPTLLHAALFLFFAGLAVFLFNINLTIFKLVLSWISLCMALYGYITFVPIFRPDSPYRTPLSLLVWNVVTGVPYLTLCTLQQLSFFVQAYDAFAQLVFWNEDNRRWLEQGMQKTAEETALKSLTLDAHAILWTFDSLDDDHEMECFFSDLPGFRRSEVVADPLPSLTKEGQESLLAGLIGLIARTFSPNSLPEPEKKRRAIICEKALNPEDIDNGYQLILERILFRTDRYTGLETAEFGRIMKGWADGLSGKQDTALFVQAILEAIVAKAKRRDDYWFILASDILGVPETVLRDYATHGDSLSLAILIHVTRQQFIHYREQSWPKDRFWQVLDAACEFNAQDTLPELQHKFCALWNQIAREAKNDNAWEMDNNGMAYFTLGQIRNIYLALHHHTDSPPPPFSASTDDVDDILKEPSSFPECNVPGHRIHEVSASTALTPALTVPHNHNTVFIPSFGATGRSPDTTQGSIDTSTRMMAHSIPDPSASDPPPKLKDSTSPPDAVTVPRTADRRTPSDDPNVPSSPPVATVLDYTSMLPTGPPFSSDSPVNESDHVYSSPESHSSMQTPAASGPSRSRLSTVPSDPAVAAEGDDSAKAVSRKEMDALQPSSVIHEDIIATPDRPPHSPSPLSVVGVAIAGPSRHSLDAEYTGDHYPHPSIGQYDIV